jgi:hypothetical protein
MINLSGINPISYHGLICSQFLEYNSCEKSYMFRRLKRIANIVKSDGLISGISWLITTLYHRVIPQKQVIWLADLTILESERISIPDNIEIRCINSIEK